MIEKRGRPLAYHSLTYEELGEYIGAKGVVPVKKSWLENLGFPFGDDSEHQEVPCIKQEQKPELPKIKYEITEFEV